MKGTVSPVVETASPLQVNKGSPCCVETKTLLTSVRFLTVEMSGSSSCIVFARDEQLCARGEPHPVAEQSKKDASNTFKGFTKPNLNSSSIACHYAGRLY